MARVPIKSVRIRSDKKYPKVPGGLDAKLELNQIDKDRGCIAYFASDNSNYSGLDPLIFTKKLWGEKSDDEIISLYLRNVPDWKIIEDPFTTKPPYKRKFGEEEYLLNCGGRIKIIWSPSGGEKWSDDSGFELDKVDGVDKSTIKKTVEITPGSDSNGEPKMTFENEIKYLKDSKPKEFEGTMTDLEIISKVLADWKIKVPNFDKLKIYNPTTVKVTEWPANIAKFSEVATDDLKYLGKGFNTGYISPLKAETPPQPASATASTAKEKIKFILPTTTLKAKEDIPTITIYLGPTFSSNQLNQPDNLLDDEYTESGFQGEEETGLTKEEWTNQDKSSKQEDSSNVNFQPGPPADIKPVTSFDALINLADKCARELGKNPRVNAQNMKINYKAGVHGLCPQGTQAVLYALTGIKALGKLTGNADWFSFKSPTQPSGGEGKGDFAKTGYYNNKIPIKQINGSWKGTYLDNRQKSQWQVGDIIAMGYVPGKNYGHIQVWTGYCWMSDFKQDAIQQNHVDPNSVALWRLNQQGIAAVQKQSGGGVA